MNADQSRCKPHCRVLFPIGAYWLLEIEMELVFKRFFLFTRSVPPSSSSFGSEVKQRVLCLVWLNLDPTYLRPTASFRNKPFWVSAEDARHTTTRLANIIRNYTSHIFGSGPNVQENRATRIWHTVTTLRWMLTNVPSGTHANRAICIFVAKLDATSPAAHMLQWKLMAFIWDSSRLDFEAAQDCELVTAGELFGRSGYGIGLQKGSPWADAVTLAILDFHESGFMESLDNKWILQGNLNLAQCEQNEKTPNTLGLKNMAGVFILVAGGIAFGVVLILIEMVYKKHQTRKQKRLELARHAADKWRGAIERGCAAEVQKRKTLRATIAAQRRLKANGVNDPSALSLSVEALPPLGAPLSLAGMALPPLPVHPQQCLGQGWPGSGTASGAPSGAPSGTNTPCDLRQRGRLASVGRHPQDQIHVASVTSPPRGPRSRSTSPHSWVYSDADVSE
ncbi:glutamate receptor ionotropic, kainate 5-like [Frankliniella occidentalis]|uniref:Glutamate receptor ionotropic, kainate 5-like n=1 Tax=Frankliniella occidentalis TaxID=133901 RepID=A0A9C6U1U6_FRAOC|nr:glutamate receptor ionotropic, kainate 5-like [Frankliniella occidentalis]